MGNRIFSGAVLSITLAISFFCWVFPVNGEDDPFEQLLESEEAEEGDLERLDKSLFFEAEDMRGVTPRGKKNAAWVVSSRTPMYTSRACCENLKSAEISQRIYVPAKGEYVIWVRYNLAVDKQAPFSVIVEQGGRTVFDKRYYGFIPKGGMVKSLQEDYGLWFDLSGMQEGLFSGEGWVWQRMEVSLGRPHLVKLYPLRYHGGYGREWRSRWAAARAG